jgi:hypothetical protein
MTSPVPDNIFLLYYLRLYQRFLNKCKPGEIIRDDSRRDTSPGMCPYPVYNLNDLKS